MKTIKRNGKKYKEVNIGRGQTILKEVQPNRFIQWIVNILKTKTKWTNLIK